MPTAAKSPEISVLLPVFNAGDYLAPALESLAAQRGADFEVVAVDDGSTDGSRERLQAGARKFPWLRVLMQEHGGVSRALNRAFAESTGALVARMDADDVCAPERLQQQAEFLRNQPSVGVCGAWFRVFGSPPIGVVRTPVTDAAIRARLIFASALAHPTVMIRRAALDASDGPYSPAEDGFEDYGLWLRLATRVQFHNLPAVLLRYRRHSTQATHRADGVRSAKIRQLRLKFLEQQGIAFNASEARAHAAAGFEETDDLPTAGEMEGWLQRLANELCRRGWSDATHLRHECGEAWWRFNRLHSRGTGLARAYWRSSLVPRTPLSLARALRLALRR